MNYKIIILFLAALTTQLPTIESAKILALFTSHSKSHLIIHMAVTKALIERGHNITVVTTVDLNESNPKYTHVKLPVNYDFRDMISKMVKMSEWQKFIQFMTGISTMMSYSKEALKSPEMKKLMDTESFDLVILGYFMNEFELGVAAHFKCPSVLIWMVQPFHGINQLVGNPDEVSHIPNVMWSTKINMNFFDRVKNFLFSVVDNIMWWNLRRVYNQFYMELFPPQKYPSFDETLKNVSLILCNHHFTQGPVKANVPAIIEIGGIQIDENPKALPQDIQQHLDSATTDGAIYFSLGSNVHSTDLDKNTTNLIYNVFASLKQKVIWKWESDDVPGNSKNILFKKWFPQNSVLAHTNTKLFITHGGKGSVVESEYSGTPMIGIPIFGDQKANVETLVSNGYGLGLDLQSLTEEKLKDAINEVLTNTKYHENIKHYRNLFHDRPMKAKETAVFWIEYVIRHNGAKHMQSPAVNMSAYQLMGLDVIAFIAVILYIVYKIIKCITKFLWKLSCRICGNFCNKNKVSKSNLSNKKRKFKTKKQ